MSQSMVLGSNRIAIPNFVKKALSLTLQKKIVPPERLWDLLAFEGSFSVDLDQQRFQVSHTGEWLENSLFWKGISGYEPISFELWKNACRFSQTILDIGANTGLYSLIAKTVNPGTQVYAFEPLPSFNAALRKNIRLNGFDVEVVEQAVSDFIGTAEFYAPQRGQGNLYSSSLSLERWILLCRVRICDRWIWSKLMQKDRTLMCLKVSWVRCSDFSRILLWRCRVMRLGGRFRRCCQTIDIFISILMR
jgi:FkbM family methyltransferase